MTITQKSKVRERRRKREEKQYIQSSLKNIACLYCKKNEKIENGSFSLSLQLKWIQKIQQGGRKSCRIKRYLCVYLDKKGL
ncbi:hypothetical protein HMPREF0083_01353 [Aneurinibacillus aneurinilyticus ATCC 12856]|jgi:hypothetical protein|uniref:Uncharacterized protein n=1 Tax=Aneurinibacillus aneurinilyticus ATCC 12856 TaxID=649747 RepID=U1X7C9_ANEAE|nr:hypothetical protein HMPREF0083_01353 [Aneurinibacillus aneurinilyticus ATCC 12856]